MGWRRRGAAGVKKGRAGDCGGIGIPATSPVIPGGRCGAGKEGERRALTRGPGVAERGRGRWQVGKGDAAWALVAWSCGASSWAVRGERRGASWAERRVTGPWVQLGQGLGLGFQGRWDWAWVEGWAAGLV